jgi:hypothetical protein
MDNSIRVFKRYASRVLCPLAACAICLGSTTPAAFGQSMTDQVCHFEDTLSVFGFLATEGLGVNGDCQTADEVGLPVALSVSVGFDHNVPAPYDSSHGAIQMSFSAADCSNQLETDRANWASLCAYKLDGVTGTVSVQPGCEGTGMWSPKVGVPYPADATNGIWTRFGGSSKAQARVLFRPRDARTQTRTLPVVQSVRWREAIRAVEQPTRPRQQSVMFLYWWQEL